MTTDNGVFTDFSILPLTREKYMERMKLLKRLITMFPEISILYKTLGLIYEYTGNIRTAVKFYLIFLHKKSTDLEFLVRHIILVFWCDIKRCVNSILLKMFIKYNLFHLEIASFKTKILEQNHYFKQSSNMWKKIIQKYLADHCIKFRKNKNVGLCSYLAIFWIRIIKRHSDPKILNLECLKLINSYHCIYWKKEPKTSYIITQLLIHKILKPNINIKTKKNVRVFLEFLNLNRLPYYLNIIRKFSEDYRKKSILQTEIGYVSYFSLNIKWFRNLSNGLHKNNRVFFFLFKEKSIYEYFSKSYESYNIFARLPKLKLNLLLKLAKIQKLNGLLSESLDSYRIISRDWIENLEPIAVVTKIFKKISKEKFLYHGYMQRMKIKIRKNLIMSRKKNIKKTNLKSLKNKAEKFFVMQKIQGLIRLVLSVILTVIRNSSDSDLHKSKNFSKIKLTGYDSSNLIQNESNLINCSYDINENTHSSSIILAFKNLIEMIFILIFNDKFMFVSKTLRFFILSRFFFRKSHRSLRYILLSLAFKKKNFKKAYEYSRLVCLESPNSFISWCILSKIEKRTGNAVSKTLRFTLRLLSKFPMSIPGMIFAGNHCSVFGSHGYALAEYFQAYRWKKDSSFLNFSIHLQYLYRSLNRRNLNSEYSLLMSLCFFYHYKLIRFFSVETEMKRSKTSIFLQMEVFFNKARLYLFLGMKYLALKTFKRVLNKKNTISSISKYNRRFKMNKIDNLRNESMFNIYLLHLTSGNKILSNQTIKNIQM
nr:TATA binding protein of transcription factor IIIC [Cryptomonas sp.]